MDEKTMVQITDTKFSLTPVAVERIAAISRAKKEADRAEKEWKRVLLESVEEARKAGMKVEKSYKSEDGTVSIRYEAEQERTVFDEDAFAIEFPELYHKFVTKKKKIAAHIVATVKDDARKT